MIKPREENYKVSEVDNFTGNLKTSLYDTLRNPALHQKDEDKNESKNINNMDKTKPFKVSFPKIIQRLTILFHYTFYYKVSRKRYKETNPHIMSELGKHFICLIMFDFCSLSQ